MAKILLIDDEIQLINMYKKKLELEGFEVIYEMTSDDGWRSLKKSTPDLVLLDVMLPGTYSGISLLKKIKMDELTKNIPVLMLTNMDSMEKEALLEGAVDFILKANSSLEEVVAKIRKYLS